MWAQYAQHKGTRRQLDGMKPGKQEQFQRRHSAELALFASAANYLNRLKETGEAVTPKQWRVEAATLTAKKDGLYLEMQEEIKTVELLDTDAYYMSNIELLIGQSSTEGERKRAAKQQNKAFLPARTNGGHLSDSRPPEIKREIKKGQAARAFGRYQNVFWTDKELAELQAEFPTVWEQYIEKLSAYMESTGKTFAACIAHALTEQAVPVLMTNFSKILNSLSGMFSEDRNKYLSSSNHFRLLIIDDLEIERNSEYALEQVYNVVDSRYLSHLPFIITTHHDQPHACEAASAE